MNLVKMFHLYKVTGNLFEKGYYTIVMLLKCSIYKELVFGNNISFFGFPKFTLKVGSKITIGDNCTFRSKPTSNLIGINRPCILSALRADSEILIGKYCGFSGTVIGAFGSISIGDYVRCGANTLITDSDWHTDDYRSGSIKPVVIEDNVWLGEGVKVLKGVTIGKNSVIGAGSVVVKSIPANVIAAGNPCKVIKQLNER